MLDEYGAQLHVRMCAANARVTQYAPRKRLAAQYLAKLQELDAFDGIFLPRNTPHFLRTAYCARLPYHGICHPLVMLLTAISLREQVQPLVLPAICGHDAGHNGIGAKSPEVLHAALTVSWMTDNSAWLVHNDIVRKVGRSKLAANPGAVVQVITATQFPHGYGATDDAQRQMRWFDTLRQATGASAEHLGTLFNLGDRLTRFRMYVLESIGLIDEITGNPQQSRETLHTWVREGMLRFFLAENVLPDLRNGGIYCEELAGEFPEQHVLEISRALDWLISCEMGREKLLGIYDFCHGDFMLEEYVAECERLEL